MSKGKKLPLLGFDVVLGEKSHPPDQLRNGWGIDDNSLFNNIVSYIDTIDANQPWMIGVLTTGTHSPYLIPKDYKPELKNSRQRAIQYADDALSELMHNLEARNLLENTTVLITADESRAIAGINAVENDVALSWLPLIIVSPDQPAQLISDYVVNSQFQDIVWELLYNKPTGSIRKSRHSIVFGNVLSKRLLWYEPDNQKLLVCQTSDFACGIYNDVSDLGNLDNVRPVRQAFFPALKAIVEKYE